MGRLDAPQLSPTGGKIRNQVQNGLESNFPQQTLPIALKNLHLI